jgi:hypothetical protein
MTDRVAALLGALHEPYDDPRDDDPDWGTNGRCRACGEDGVWTRTVDAASVLAALPPDWCGHGPRADYVWMTTFCDHATEIADLRTRLEAADAQTDRQAAEIARLRKLLMDRGISPDIVHEWSEEKP